MHWKDALHTFAVGDSTHRERLIQTAAFSADYRTGEHLDSLLVSLENTRMNAYTVANGKRRRVALLLLFLDGINNLIHRLVVGPANAGRTLSFEGVVFATRIRNNLSASRKPEREPLGPTEIICENLWNLWLIPVLHRAPVAQLDRALASGAKGCGFDPRRAQFLIPAPQFGLADLFYSLRR